MIRGSWQSPRLTKVDILVLIVTLITQGTIRSWDYTTGNDGVSQSLTIIEDAFALWIWGVILATLTAFLIIGISLKIHIIVWASHALLGCVYFVLLVGMTIAVFATNPFPYDGIRSGSVLLTPMMLHFVFAIRTGPSPLDFEVEYVDEAVVKDHA